MAKYVLIADDDLEDRLLLEEALDIVEFLVERRFVTNGEELVLYMARPISHIPLLILLDLNMPKMDGIATLKYLKSTKQFCQIPVIILSTSNDKTEITHCMSLGAQQFITKPSSFPDLVAFMRQLKQDLPKLFSIERD